MSIRLLTGDCREVLRTLPDESVHCVVTSPPYWGLRDYGTAGQLGLEPTYQEYVANMVELFREVRRVLRKDGTIWLNLGDSYATGAGSGRSMGGAIFGKQNEVIDNGSYPTNQPNRMPQPGLKPKDLTGIPWRVAFGLQSDGWYLRQDIIWSKPNPMPESVTDRCTKAHEYLFLLSKSARYYYDAEAIKEEGSDNSHGGTPNNGGPKQEALGRHSSGQLGIPSTRNKRSVWEIVTSPFPEAHFATFPSALIEPCIKAGTSAKGCCAKCGAPWVRDMERHADPRKPYITTGIGSKVDASRNDGCGPNKVLREDGRGGDLARQRWTTGGWSPSCACASPIIPCTVLDCFGGAGTTGLVADRLGRDAILIELNPQYAAMAERRINDDAGMFAQVAAE